MIRRQAFDSFPAVQTDTLDAGDEIVREVSWNLMVRGETSGSQVAAPDGDYKLRADFYAYDGERLPGQPEILLEFPIVLERGISE